MRRVVVLRPAPGAARTMAALAAAGMEATALPLFAVRPVDWTMPPGEFDAVVLTSANAVRHAGLRLAAMGLPVLAVGPATAAAARAAGLSMAETGERDLAALLDAHAARWPRLLHPAGRERTDDPRLTTVTVYAADPLPVAASDLAVLDGAVALVHSPRAARRLAAIMAEHARDRSRVQLAAISLAAGAAAGDGWGAIGVADRPTDAAIVAAVRRLTGNPATGISG